MVLSLPRIPHGELMTRARRSPSLPSSSADSLGVYFRQMSKVPLLTREGECELARRMELGEHAIRRAILSCPTGLASLVALGCSLRRGEFRARDLVARMPDDEDDWELRERT